MLQEEDFLSLLQEKELHFNLLKEKASEVSRARFQGRVFLRGLLEISSFCKENCFYCGIRRDHKETVRYRLTEDEILSQCEKGYSLGLRTFVLQGGEDPTFTDERLLPILETIKTRFPEACITLSLGVRERKSYENLRAYADRYLLRFESIDPKHFSMLHPKEQSVERRMEALHDLRDLKYQVGTGFMVGTPFETLEHLAKDLCFIQSFRPEMIGIGPFVSTKETPFSSFSSGSVEMSLYLISILRLLLKDALIPATTALETLSKEGRMRGILHGANVIMPSITPSKDRKSYAIYDHKASKTLEELVQLEDELKKIGAFVDYSRGDYRSINV